MRNRNPEVRDNWWVARHLERTYGFPPKIAYLIASKAIHKLGISLPISMTDLARVDFYVSCEEVVSIQLYADKSLTAKNN